MEDCGPGQFTASITQIHGLTGKWQEYEVYKYQNVEPEFKVDPELSQSSAVKCFPCSNALNLA